MEVQTVYNGENSVNVSFVKNIKVVDKNVGDIHSRYGKKKDFTNKYDRKCSLYGVSGHTKDVCFKLNGYPDGYKQLKERKSGGKVKTYAKKSVIDEIPQHMDSNIQQAIAKYMNSGGNNYMNVANMTEIKSTRNFTLYFFRNIESDSWIIDIGASNHICHDKSIFNELHDILGYNPVILPDGSTINVTKAGTVTLNKNDTNMCFIS